MRDADRAGEAPPLLVLHDEHEVPGAARADLVGPRVVLAGVVQIQGGLLLVDANVPRDERRDLPKGQRAVAGPAVAREDVEEDGAREEDIGGVRERVVVAEREVMLELDYDALKARADIPDLFAALDGPRAGAVRSESGRRRAAPS